MKKILPVLFGFLFLLTMPVHAAAGKLTATAAETGRQITVTVRLDNPGIVATLIKMTYDSKVLELTDVKNGDVFPQSAATFGRNYSLNPYTVLWDQSTRRDNNTTSGTLFTATIAVKGGTAGGKTTVSFAVEKSSTFDVDLNEVRVADASCTVNVPAAATGTSGTTAAKPADTTKTTAARPTANNTTTTRQPLPPPTAPKPTLTNPGLTIPTTKASGTVGQTTATRTNAAPTTAAASSAVSATAASAADGQKTTAGTAASQTQPALTEADVGTVPAQEETAESTLPAESGTQQEAVTDSPAPQNHRNLLWLLLLIPAAVVVVLIVKKKK